MSSPDPLEAAYAVTRMVSRARTVAEACDVVLAACSTLFGTDRSAVLLRHDTGGMRFCAWRGLSEGYRARVDGHSPWPSDAGDPEPLVVPDVANDGEVLGALRGAVLEEGIRALAFVPLTHDDHVLGKFMVYFAEPRTLSKAELTLARLVAAQVGFAIARLRAERHAQEARDELEAVLETVPEGVVVYAPDGRVLFANDRAIDGWWRRDQVIGTVADRLGEAFDIVDEAGQPVEQAALPQRRAVQGEAAEGTFGLRRRDDTAPMRWLRFNARPARTPEGELRFAVAVMHDVTRARREAATRQFLLEAGAMLASSLDYEATLAAVAQLAVPRLADWCSVQVRDPHGAARTLAVAHTDPERVAFVRMLAELYPQDPDAPTGAANVLRTGVAEVYNDIPEALLVASARDAEHLRLMRELRLAAVMVVPMKARGRVLGVVSFASSESGIRFGPEDLVTATKLADRAALAIDNARLYSEARESRARLEIALEAGRMGTWEYDPNTGRFSWSSALAAMHGSRVELLPPTLDAYLATIHPDDREDARRSIQHALAEATLHLREYRIVRPDGSMRWVEARGLVERDEAGQPVRMVGVRVDVTERKLAEQRLAEERERLGVTLSSIGDAVIATDRAGHVTLMNEVAEGLTGWGAVEAAGRPLSEVFAIFSEKTGLPVTNPVEKVLQTGRVVGLANHTVIESRDGARRAIADSAAPIRAADDDIVGVVLVFRDVTQEQRLERELAKASKLESIGVLAGGIAHDFNNILTSIAANVSLADRRVGPEHPAQGRLAAAKLACERARELTRQLLTFSRGGAPIRSATSMSAVLREACGFALQGSSVLPHYELPGDLWAVDADAGQIGQVVHNIALNASQAMPSGGNLRVQASNVDLDETAWLPLPPGRYVRIELVDDGPGIAAEHLPRIFDPFFTTKPSGSGLGLATAYSILKRHDGHLMVDSSVGEGTRFTLFLPAASAEPETPAEPEPAARGRGRVLVMDDDYSIRDLAIECLVELGYDAEVATDGAEAITRYAQARALGRGFDAVMLDLTVPGGLGGRETLRRLREIDPAVRAIVSSGYSNDPVMASFRDEGFSGVLQKPFQVDDLARVLSDVLAAPATGSTVPDRKASGRSSGGTPR